MSSQTYAYLDGNAAAGELSAIFTADITAAEGRCAHCGAIRHFAEVHLYTRCPGIVARCPVCQHVVLRLVNTGRRVLVDLTGMTCLAFGTFQKSAQESKS
jgi:hypothetical protein